MWCVAVRGRQTQWDLLGALERPGSARVAARRGARKKDTAIWHWVTPERVDPSPLRMAADGAGRGQDKRPEILPTMVLAQNMLVHRSKRAAGRPVYHIRCGEAASERRRQAKVEVTNRVYARVCG